MKRILVLRLSSIGDIVLCSGLWRALVEQLDARVEVLVKPAFADLLLANPYVHKVWLYEPKDLELLLAQRFDFCLDLHNNWRTWRLRRKLTCPKGVFQKWNWRKWLLIKFKWRGILPLEVSVVDRYFAAGRALGLRADGKGLALAISPQAEAFAQAQNLPPNLIALVLGASAATKRLEWEGLVQIVHESPLPLLLIGGPEDQPMAQRLQQAQPNKVWHWVGQADLSQSIALLNRAKAVIGHDTGFSHIAAALGKPILWIWGNTVPAFGMGPHYPQGQEHLVKHLEVPKLACRPCSKLGSQQCPKGHFRCMRDQDLTQVAQWLQQFVPN